MYFCDFDNFFGPSQGIIITDLDLILFFLVFFNLKFILMGDHLAEDFHLLLEGSGGRVLVLQ